MKTAEELINSDSLIVVDGEYTDDTIEQVFSEGYEKGYKDATRWRDPEVDPPTNQDIVLVKTDNDCYATAYYHGRASEFITYGEDAYVAFGEIIGWRPIE